MTDNDANGGIILGVQRGPTLENIISWTPGGPARGLNEARALLEAAGNGPANPGQVVAGTQPVNYQAEAGEDDDDDEEEAIGPDQPQPQPQPQPWTAPPGIPIPEGFQPIPEAPHWFNNFYLIHTNQVNERFDQVTASQVAVITNVERRQRIWNGFKMTQQQIPFPCRLLRDAVPGAPITNLPGSNPPAGAQPLGIGESSDHFPVSPDAVSRLSKMEINRLGVEYQTTFGIVDPHEGVDQRRSRVMAWILGEH